MRTSLDVRRVSNSGTALEGEGDSTRLPLERCPVSLGHKSRQTSVRPILGDCETYASKPDPDRRVPHGRIILVTGPNSS